MKKTAALIILSVVAVFAFNLYRRSSKTREAFDAVALPGSLKAQLLRHGCDRVAVLPLIDFTEVGIDARAGRREDAMFAICEFVETSPHLDCHQFFNDLSSEQQVQLKVETSDDSCRATLEADGRITIEPRVATGASNSFATLVWRELAYR